MKKSKFWVASLALVIPLAILSGCGGGGGGSTTGGGGSGSVNLFATDNMSVDFDHVWVSVKQIVLVGAGGDRVVFDDAAGQIFDIKTLRDATGRRFRLLCNHAIPAGQYAGIRVVVDSSASVFPAGAPTATVATFDGSEGTSKTMSLTFPAPKNFGAGSDVIVDFDLSRWTLAGSSITATDGQFLNVVDDNGVHDVNRHNNDDYNGTVSAITGTAPDQSFTLTRGANTVTVKTTASTSVFNSSGAASPTLSNGERVEVTGVYSTADNSLTAATIKIEDDPAHDRENEIRGQITAVSAADKTLTVSLSRCDGFIPTTSTLTIQIGDTTELFSNRGVSLTSDLFFAAAATNGFVEAQGNLDGNVLTATKVKIEDEGEHHGGGNGGGGGHHGAAELSGTASAADAAAGTFTLAVTRWEGLLLGAGAQVNVASSASTEFKLNGSHSTSAAFFSALAAATSPNNVVSVEGTYDDTTKILTATEVSLGAGDGHGGHGGDD